MIIISKILEKTKKLDKKIKTIMYIGFKVSFIICTISVLSLLTYETLYSLPNLFYAGITLMHTGLMFACTSFICAIGFDTIKNQLT